MSNYISTSTTDGSYGYVNSEQIQVFPSTRRINQTHPARLISESSIVGIVNKLIDKDGFVITSTDTFSSISTSEIQFEFNIHGYYFRFDDVKEIIKAATANSNVKYIYGVITIDDGNEFKELKGYVENTYYTGIKFIGMVQDEDPTSEEDGIYALKLFEGSGSTWTVPAQSRIKFNSSSLQVDGGVI